MIGIDLLVRTALWEDASGGDHGVVLLEDTAHSVVGSLGGEDVSAFMTALLERGMDLVLDLGVPVLPVLHGWSVSLGAGDELTIAWPSASPLAAGPVELPAGWAALARGERRVLILAGLDLGLAALPAGGALIRPELACRNGTLAGGVARFVP
ncbi:hypothetical protein [Actinocatenispora rupis]|uniref:Uncharacterized protein n=1 Tax=Actinocatenispora rupis TaxID=519421 RepID=A0A8J3NCQ7_9ACTN|nr:hypothetical protein [Actinocatenispora rupis]GID10709.1 hypothetical protein Aru02nite_15980 [Actinocatenispora rupis]